MSGAAAKRDHAERRVSQENFERQEQLREQRGGLVSFVRSWRNFEHEVDSKQDYDRRSTARLKTDSTRKVKIQTLAILSFVAAMVYLTLLHTEAVEALWLSPFKILPVGLMLLMVLTLGDRREYGTRVACGLFFCGIGDVCLELEPLLSAMPLFLIGLVAGLAGHCAYAYAFYGQASVTMATAALPAACAAVILNVLRPWLEAELIGPVLAYTGVAGVMIALALSRVPDGFSALWSWRCGAAGALLFAVSDTILAVDRFVGALPHARLAVAATYFLAQFCIAMSARGSQPRPLSKALGSVENFLAGQSFRVVDDE